MSREELVEAYLRGDVGRRAFVRRLVALGVSLTAALAYAQMAPDVASAGKCKARPVPPDPCQLFPFDRVPDQAKFHAQVCGA